MLANYCFIRQYIISEIVNHQLAINANCIRECDAGSVNMFLLSDRHAVGLYCSKNVCTYIINLAINYTLYNYSMSGIFQIISPMKKKMQMCLVKYVL